MRSFRWTLIQQTDARIKREHLSRETDMERESDVENTGRTQVQESLSPPETVGADPPLESSEVNKLFNTFI